MQLSAASFGHGSVPSARSLTAGFIISAVAAYWLILTLGYDTANFDDRAKVGTTAISGTFNVGERRWCLSAQS